MIFSDPILADPDAFAVKPGNPLGLRTLKDVATKKAKIGILTGAQEITVAQHAGVSSDQITTYSDQPSLFADLKAGRIDAIMNAKSAYRAMPPGDWVVTASIPDGIVASAGIGFRKSDKALRDLFNAKLRAMKKTGTFAKISRQFGFDPASAEEASTAEACASLFPKPKTK
jgi:polar amino acid transport system substrate-binding protein